MKKIAILGSTGSIGVQTMKLLENEKDFEIDLVCAKFNIDLLKEQIDKYNIKNVYVSDERAYNQLKSSMNTDNKCEVFNDFEHLLSILRNTKYHLVINAMVGMIGVLPTYNSILAGNNVAIANKETLVCAGHILMPLAKKNNVKIYAIDSEHSAIEQCLVGEDREKVESLIITASGGPFFNKKFTELENVTVEEALAHPNWSMGRKISIDSATMVNKALEVMEARWLFDFELDKISVVIHPQSIIHSMVCFVDGAIKAQLGVTDMLLPISYAIYGYKREKIENRLDLAEISALNFYNVDYDMYPGFKLGLEALRIGGSMPTVFNAANEMAVDRFLNKKIGYCDIPKLIDKYMNEHIVIKNPSIDDIMLIGHNILG